jgi:hypothetical protein
MAGQGELARSTGQPGAASTRPVTVPLLAGAAGDVALPQPARPRRRAGQPAMSVRPLDVATAGAVPVINDRPAKLANHCATCASISRAQEPSRLRQSGAHPARHAASDRRWPVDRVSGRLPKLA